MAQTQQNNDVMMAVLAYFLFFLPLIAAKDSKLAMFHANQSLVILIGCIAVAVLTGIIPLISILNLALLVLWILGLIQAAQGQMKPLPVIGTIKIIK